MKLFGKDLDQSVAIVAEIGVNHEGDLDKAHLLLSLAAGAGADAVKFQSYTPARYASASDPDRLKRVTQFALDEDAHRELATRAKELGVAFLSTPLSEDWVPLLSELGEAIKIASGDLTFEPAIRAAAQTGKPVLISTGLGTLGEIETTFRWFEEEVGSSALQDRLVLMHCVSAYPVPVEQANVYSVPYLAERFDVHIGYSNHVIGPESCWAAVANGASVLEVHFTDQKHGREFRDHELSFEPADLEALVEAVPKIRQSLGTRSKERLPCEQPLLEAVRKGVVAARDLEKGSALTVDDVMYARPATHVPSGEVSKLLGVTLQEPIARGECITLDGAAVRKQ